MSFMDEIKKQADEIKLCANNRKDRNMRNLKAVLDTQEGRAVLADIIELSGVYVIDDANSAVYSAGRRSVGLQILLAIKAVAPEQWIRLNQEFIFNQQKENK